MTRQQRRHGVLIALVFLFLFLSAQRDAVARQQYLVVNIIPGERYEEVFEQVRKLQSPKSSAGVRLGIGAIFSYLNESRDRCKSRVVEFLSLSEQYDIPVVVQLDGEQWWEARPDLWNWWDRGRDGYDPRNRWNVEWTGWDAAHAMKMAWRNWGRQIRVLPHPNLMSPAYRQACHDEMRVLVPLILRWWMKLPDDKKSLLLGSRRVDAYGDGRRRGMARCNHSNVIGSKMPVYVHLQLERHQGKSRSSRGGQSNTGHRDTALGPSFLPSNRAQNADAPYEGGASFCGGARYLRQLQPLKNCLNSHCSWRFGSHEHKSQKKLNIEVYDAVLARMDF